MQFIYLAKIEVTTSSVGFLFVTILVTTHKTQPFRKQFHSANVKQVDPACCFKS